MHEKLKNHIEKIAPLTEDEFLALAGKAKQICPISKLLDSDIRLSAEFVH